MGTLISFFFPSADVDVDKPDEKSIMTYVAQFLKHHPGQKESDSDEQLIEEVTIVFSVRIFWHSSCFRRFVFGMTYLNQSQPVDHYTSDVVNYS